MKIGDMKETTHLYQLLPSLLIKLLIVSSLREETFLIILGSLVLSTVLRTERHKIYWIIEYWLFKKNHSSQDLEVHTCNSSTLGHWGNRIKSLSPAGKLSNLVRECLKIKLKGRGWARDVAHCESSGFNPWYSKKNHSTKHSQVIK